MDAVPRTLRWLEKLTGICTGKIGGVIPNETDFYGQKLITRQKNSYEYLIKLMDKFEHFNVVFENCVKRHSNAVSPQKGIVAAAFSPQHQSIYQNVTDEFRRRLGDGRSFEAENLVEGETLACDYAKFHDHFGFFLPLAGITTVKQIRENAFDIKATGRLNKLYVELRSFKLRLHPQVN